MQGFQPVYSGNNLTQAWRSAGEFQMQGARATAAAYESLGKSIGGALQSVGSSIAGAIGQAKIDNAAVPESQVKAAEAAGIDFNRVSTDSDGVATWKPVTQKQFNLGLENQSKLVQMQTAGVALAQAQNSVRIKTYALDSLGAGTAPKASNGGFVLQPWFQ